MCPFFYDSLGRDAGPPDGDQYEYMCEGCFDGIDEDGLADTESGTFCEKCWQERVEEDERYWASYFGVTEGKGPVAAMKPYEHGDYAKALAARRESR